MQDHVERHLFETSLDTFVGLYTQIQQIRRQVAVSCEDDRKRLERDLNTAQARLKVCWMGLKGYQDDPDSWEIVEQNNIPTMAREILSPTAYRRCKPIKPPVNRKRVAKTVPAKTRKRAAR
ncbi:MAG: hypothetical protein PHR28_13925 [candidate division Zixibacteria bacterium]|jgi:hypothetical protein|nr:hypothetical protein [candidate division Zixibacteria bacterium]